MTNSDYTEQLRNAVQAIETLFSGDCDVGRAHALARNIGQSSEQAGFHEITSVACQAEEFLARYLDGGNTINREIFENLMLNLQSICRTAIARTGTE